MLLLYILVVDSLINAGEDTSMFELSQTIYEFSWVSIGRKCNKCSGAALLASFQRNEDQIYCSRWNLVPWGNHCCEKVYNGEHCEDMKKPKRHLEVF